MPIRLGTRASALARWQAEWVAARLNEQNCEVELVPITTTGDRQQGPIETVGGQGLFTKEIQRALLADQIDLAVHSLKDLPTDPVPGLVLAAVPERGPTADVLLMASKNEVVDAMPLSSDLLPIPKGAVVGTGSLRRRAQLLHLRPDLAVADIRGNVETRLRKLEQGDFDALILAEAGLRRLGLLNGANPKVGSLHSWILPPEWMLPAVGQGALALESRENDAATRQVLSKIDHPATHLAVLAERAMLAALQGGCLAPIAALACVDISVLTLTGRVIGCDGVERLDAKAATELAVTVEDGATTRSRAVELGRKVARLLMDQGAQKLIEASRRCSTARNADHAAAVDPEVLPPNEGRS